MKKALKWVAIGFGVLIVIGIAANAGKNNNQSNGTTTATQPQAQTQTTKAAPQHFSGNGSRTYNTINVPTDSTVKWTDSGEGGYKMFQIVSLGDGLHNLSISGENSTGESDLAARTYHDVHVDGMGDWTFDIVPK